MDRHAATRRLRHLAATAGVRLPRMHPHMLRHTFVTTMLDAGLPLTITEWEEWGDPQEPEAYSRMKAYSPYDNVERKAYPWLLVTTSLNDSQVGYWEPAKWVAKLRAMKTDTNPLYIKINMAGGHGGSSGRYDVLRERAFRYAFMLDAVGMSDK